MIFIPNFTKGSNGLSHMGLGHTCRHIWHLSSTLRVKAMTKLSGSCLHKRVQNSKYFKKVFQDMSVKPNMMRERDCSEPVNIDSLRLKSK